MSAGLCKEGRSVSAKPQRGWRDPSGVFAIANGPLRLLNSGPLVSIIPSSEVWATNRTSELSPLQKSKRQT